MHEPVVGTQPKLMGDLIEEAHFADGIECTPRALEVAWALNNPALVPILDTVDL